MSATNLSIKEYISLLAEGDMTGFSSITFRASGRCLGTS